MEMNEKIDVKENEQTRTKRKSKVWLSSLSGAVFGSILTLYAGSSLGVIHIASQPQTENAAAAASKESSKGEVQIQQTSSPSGGMIDTIEQVSPAVVGVVNYQQASNFYSNDQQQTESGTGSGVIFKKSGGRAYIVTNNHVVEGADKVEISLISGEKVPAKIVGVDSLTDLAVLEIESKYATKVANFGDSSKLRPGEQVAAIGNPLGLQFSRTVTQGIISGTERTISVSTSQGEWDLNVIQTDAAINPGNSGGALINSAGQVVGINSLKISQSGVEGLGFAIPSNDVVPIVNDLMEGGEVKRPYIGVGLQNINELPDYVLNDQLRLPQEVHQGVVITAVEPFSPGAEAGLKEKDVIVSIDGTKVNNIGELRKYLYTKTSMGKSVEMKLYRDGQQRTVSLKMREKGINQ
ncbi:S1C family serine protease [Priestia abyssalis]|uniref:S1C family serine protease n=1 Tax=Priestia abyssalis TaxID=1221450 RepID=UPI0011172911|nr:S1C family serine protease [Priestia abyssalis]